MTANYNLLVQVGGDWKRLDLAADLSLQFASKNCVFNFANSEVNRSVGFNAPATPNNNGIFDLAKDPARYGERMRIKLPAQLQFAAGTCDGYLYAQSADEDAYKCVFVFGELFGLAAIKNAGKLGDFITPMTNLLRWYANTNIRYANGTVSGILGNFGEYDIVRYIDNDKDTRWDGAWSQIGNPYPPMPSVEMYDLIVRALGDLGIAHNLTKQAEDYTLRIVPPAKRATFGTARIEQAAGLTITFNNHGTEPRFGISKEQWNNVELFNISSPLVGGANDETKCAIKFANDVPTDLFLGSFVAQVGDEIEVVPYGDYKPTGINAADGSPLAGREIEIDVVQNAYSPARYRFYRMADFIRVKANGNIIISAASNDQATADVSFVVTQPATLKNYLYEYPAIAELDLMQLILTYAHLRGYMVTWQNDTLMFVPLQFVDGRCINIDERALKWSDLNRKFADFAQHNIVRLGGDKEVGSVDYTVPNEILKAEDTLFESDFTAGEYTPDYAPEFGYLKDAEQDGSAWKPADFDAAIFQCTADSIYMKVAAMTKNSVLQTLCTTSTQIKVQFTMILSQFFWLKYNSSFQFHGKRYAWTEAQWSGGICTATLQQLA